MNSLVVFVSFLAFSSAQFPDVPGVPGPRWTGPFANHVSGQRVADTPEVAAAKAQHAEAHIKLLAILPELPAEERYIENEIPVQQPNIHLNNQPQYHVQPTSAPIQNFPQQHGLPNSAPVQTAPKFQQYAEEIPRSQIGEVPEVHAARQAHLAAFSKIQAALPPLREEPVNTNFPSAPQQSYVPQSAYSQFNQNGAASYGK